VALARGDANAAEARLDAAMALFGTTTPPPTLAWARARASALLGDLEGAMTRIREGLEAHPGHPVLKATHAVFLEASGDLAAAEAELRDAIAEGPGMPQVTKNLGDICYRSGRYEEAESWYRRTVALAPDLGDDLYFKLGNLALKRHEAEEARRCWEQALTLNPDHQLARANLESLAGSAA